MAHGISPRTRQRGVGLIEVSFALAIGIALVSAAMVSTKKSKDRAQAIELAAEEQLIFSAADAFFRSQCRSGSLPTSTTTAALEAQGFLKRPARDVWGANWGITYMSAPRRAQVSANLLAAPASMVPWIGEYTGAYTAIGSTVYWIHNIRIAADTTASNQMEFRAMYESSDCG